ncbi:hypothetical protein BGZ60DRAFT_413637 [Tricladium varicosporioides]|nr:hypothetical protein BGZ60DRAFT_413637 [Hymenoscyphus varicosporioides]
MVVSKRRESNHGRNSGYLSDESDFYGDVTAKQELEDRASTFDARDWWDHKIPSLTEIANSEKSTVKENKTATLYNPYEGQLSARQLGESVNEFLNRLRPASTRVSQGIPWIYIANPYCKAPTAVKNENGQHISSEGPPDEESNWAKFVVLGNQLLEQLRIVKNNIEKQKKGSSQSNITKAINKEKEAIVKRVLDTAVELHCTSGKWMLFCPPNEINSVWEVVARAVANNELGSAAKVAPDDGNDRKPRLICIYTKDFSDMEDVTRVLVKLKDLGVVDNRGKNIYYKCDAYTYLGLNSTNDYNIQASLYKSGDLLTAKGGKPKALDKKGEGFFYKKKKDDGDWKPLGCE